MANANSSDKCKHGNTPGDCVECNPIFKGVEVPPKRTEGGE